MRIQIVDVRNRNAVDSLHYQEFRARIFPIDFWHVKLCRTVEIAPKLGCVSGFGLEVQLIENNFLIVCNDLDRTQAATKL